MSPLFLFFLLFFSRFFVFFLAFYYSFFLILCSFLHFLIFECFSFSFVIFSEEKVSSFLFSFISFKYVLLLALVSLFNCFLRSRCSMDMWCPDDVGRDSWDWVGPPAWVRACFNSPEWGGGSSPAKTEPLQIVLLLLLFVVVLLTCGPPQQGCQRLSMYCNSGTSTRQHCQTRAPVVTQQRELNNLAKNCTEES